PRLAALAECRLAGNVCHPQRLEHLKRALSLRREERRERDQGPARSDPILPIGTSRRPFRLHSLLTARRGPDLAANLLPGAATSLASFCRWAFLPSGAF